MEITETTIRKTYVPNLRQVSQNLLVDLYFKAKETREQGIIRDYAAVDIVDRLQYDFSPFEADGKTQNLIAVRTEILEELMMSVEFEEALKAYQAALTRIIAKWDLADQLDTARNAA